MSRKANKFAAIITRPLNVYNFEIRIKSQADSVNEDILLIVQSTSFPAETLQEMTLNFQGEKIIYPTKPANGGDWTITIPEGDKGQVRNELDRLKDAIYDQKTGTVMPTLWYDIEVFQKDLQENVVFSVVLHGCWMKGRNNQDLNTENVTANWSNQYTFHYTWIEDKRKEGLAGSPNPFGE